MQPCKNLRPLCRRESVDPNRVDGGRPAWWWNSRRRPRRNGRRRSLLPRRGPFRRRTGPARIRRSPAGTRYVPARSRLTGSYFRRGFGGGGLFYVPLWPDARGLGTGSQFPGEPFRDADRVIEPPPPGEPSSIEPMPPTTLPRSSSQSGHLRIQGAPAGAQVYVDGFFVGTAEDLGRLVRRLEPWRRMASPGAAGCGAFDVRSEHHDRSKPGARLSRKPNLSADSRHVRILKHRDARRRGWLWVVR